LDVVLLLHGPICKLLSYIILLDEVQDYSSGLPQH
jgi:hypothetical protein